MLTFKIDFDILNYVERTTLFEKRIAQSENFKLQSVEVRRAATAILIEASNWLVTAYQPLGETISHDRERV